METGDKEGRQAGAIAPTELSAVSYKTASAFRTALKAKLATVAKANKTFSVDELQRQFAYDRALARCFTADDSDRWVLKGAGALLARIETARHSNDIDLYYELQEVAASEAVAALEAALARDIGDHFRFQVTRVENLMEPAKGRRVHLTCMLGPKPFTSYHIDLVVGTAMAGSPEKAPPLTPLHIDGLVRPNYRVFPLADHLADKLYAMISTHDQRGRLNVSSRVKDLVDIILIARTQRISGLGLRTAILAGGYAPRRSATRPPRDTRPEDLAHRICPTRCRNPSTGAHLRRSGRSRQTAPRPRPRRSSSGGVGSRNSGVGRSLNVPTPRCGGRSSRDRRAAVSGCAGM